MMHQGGSPTTTPASTAIAVLQSNNSVATEAAVGASEESEEMNVRGVGGNRWSQEETLALLKTRFDLDTFFRDNIFRRSLWAEVSRKMGELGYMRERKKCKEKFHKLYNYYRRTKEKGKTCRFFGQLEAFETLRSTSSQQLQPPLPSQPLQTPAVTNMMISTLPSSSVHPLTQQMNVPSLQNISRNYLSDNSSSTKMLFESMMKQLLDKQEEFFEAFEKREQERIIREDSWRAQEIAKINREYEIIIAQQRSMLAAKDASLVALLQKLSENLPNQPTVQLQQPPQPSPQSPPTGVSQPVGVQPPQSSPPPPPQAVVMQTLDTAKTDNGDQDMTLASASTSSVSEFITVAKTGNKSIHG